MRYFKRPEIQVPFIFMIISVIWIIFSDRFFLGLEKNYSLLEITNIQTAKGLFFVLAVTVLIHLMIKSSNKRLMRSQDEYKDLFYNTPNPMLVFDLNTKKFCNVNKEALKTYGYSAEEFTKMCMEDLRSDKEHYSLVRKGGCNIYEHKKKNNELLICQETTRVISFKNKAARLLSAYDVTELEKAKIELTQRENQLRLILDSITDGFFILTNDLIIEKANYQFKKLVEAQVENVEGRRFTDLFSDAVNSFSYKQYLKALKTQTSLHFESYYAKTNSWYRISAYPFDRGLTVFFRDITKEKEDEIQNFQNQQNLIALINNTEDFIWSIDNNFKYYTFNEPYRNAYLQLFGEDLWTGKVALNEGQGSEHIQKWKGLYERALKGEKFFIEMDLVVNKKCHFTTVSFNPIYNAEKKVIGVGCFLQNITERKLHERKIQQQNEQLKQVASITSHQVRVPLANILGLVEILDKENPLSPANSEIIAHIKTSAQQLDKMIINMVQQTLQGEND